MGCGFLWDSFFVEMIIVENMRSVGIRADWNSGTIATSFVECWYWK